MYKFAVLMLATATLAAAADQVTFSETIAPIIYSNCTTCHRPGEAAPFSLISYLDVKKRGALIADVTQSRYMPPWHAAHGYGDFAGERRLTDAQIAAIGEWVKQGMPEGDPKKTPPPPQFTEGWHLGQPDLILEMPEAYELPASGPDIYRNFVIHTNLTEDKWVRAVEFRPSTRRVVHHVLYAHVPGGSMDLVNGRDGRPGFTGMSAIGVAGVRGGGGGSLGGWAVGGTPDFYPEDLALPLPKNSDIVLQMHFHPTGKPEKERSTIGLYFAKKPPERLLQVVQAPALFGIGAGIRIPAGEKNYVVQDSVTLPVDVRAVSVSAHAHYLAKEMKATATLPDGTVKPLLWIQDWDFAWQDRYDYKSPVFLPRGTRIDVRISYDNSADNPRNPSNPPKPVAWGEQSIDEMGSMSVVVVAENKADAPVLQRAMQERGREAGLRALADGTLRRFLEQQRESQASEK
jgi:hypothetical protein